MDRSKNSKKRNKVRAVDVMGGKCCICGYNKCLSALEFHHNEEKRNGKIFVDPSARFIGPQGKNRQAHR